MIKILLGFLLGFVGYLPLGNINLTVVQLALDESITKVWSYIVFVAFMEFVYCVGCLIGLDILLKNPQWVLALEWVSVFLFLFLAALSFFQSASSNAHFSGIGRGVFIAIFNPLQVPFWIVWGVYIMQNRIIEHDNFSLLLFGFITSIGTIAILWLYAVGGKNLVERLKVNRGTLNRFIGFVFIVLALWQLSKILWHNA